MIKKRIWQILLLLLFSLPAHSAVEDWVSAEDIKVQLDAIKSSNSTTDEAALLAKNLEGTLAFIEKAKKQQADLDALELKLKNAPKT